MLEFVNDGLNYVKKNSDIKETSGRTAAVATQPGWIIHLSRSCKRFAKAWNQARNEHIWADHACFSSAITVLSSGRLSWRNFFFFFLQDWGYWKSFVRKEQTQPKFGPQNEKGFRSGNEVRLVHKIYSFVTDIDCFNILTMLFWTNRLEEMSNDNQRLQLSIEQKNGKIRTLENKYGCRTGVTCNIGNRTCNM